MNSVLVVPQFGSGRGGKLTLGAHVLDVLVDSVNVSLQRLLFGGGVITFFTAVAHFHVLRFCMCPQMPVCSCFIITNGAGGGPAPCVSCQCGVSDPEVPWLENHIIHKFSEHQHTQTNMVPLDIVLFELLTAMFTVEEVLWWTSFM